MSDMEKLTSAEELAEKFGVEPRTILDWRRLYGWEAVKVGRSYFFTPDQVQQILSKHTVKGAKKKALPGQTSRSAAVAR